MRKVTGARAIVETIKSWGVSYVFGLPGTAILDLYDAFYGDPQIRLLTTRHEQGAAHMADGHARATGKPGVCLLSRGPGAANALIAFVNAYSESFPLVGLVGEPGTDIRGKDAFEEVDLVSMYRPATKWAAEVPRADRLVEFLMRAYREALGGRPRPVMLAIPEDLQTQVVEIADVLVPPAIPHPPGPSMEGVRGALAALTSASFPLVLAGGGVARAGATSLLVELAELLHLPVITTFQRQDAFPNQHPLFLGIAVAGPPPATSQALSQADLVMALGCRFSEMSTERFSRRIPRLIHVDIDAYEIGKVYQPETGIVSDLKAFLVAAIQMCREKLAAGWQPSQARLNLLASLREQYRSPSWRPIKAGREGVHPSEAAAALGEFQERDDIFVADCATFGRWMSRHLSFDRAGSLVGPAGGALGFGFPAALGIKLAQPDRRVFCLAGDGAFLMVVQELETAVRYRIPLITVVLNNFAYANVKIKQASRYQGRFIGSDLCNPDFAQLARLFGAHGERVERAGEMIPALERCASHPGPSVIDVILDREELAAPGTTFFTPGGSFGASVGQPGS